MAGPSLATPQSLASSPPLIRVADNGRVGAGCQDGQVASFRAPLPNKQPQQRSTAVPPAPAPVPLPRLCLQPVDKMAMSTVVAPDPATETPKLSMTSKEWVIPPRPKPGRKPATDTPPTKRKAQNRAAQRAFRERRAARVCELEQQLDEQREAHEKHDAEIKDKMHGLELDLQSFRSRCVLLESMLERERQERVRAEAQAEALRRQAGDTYSRIGGPPIQHAPLQHPGEPADARQLSSHDKTLSISNIITPPDTVGSSNQARHAQHEAEISLTCGNCSVNGPCACVEEVLASTSGCGRCGFGEPCQCLEDMPSALGLKRGPSPSSPASYGKRHRPSAGLVTDGFPGSSRAPGSSQTLQTAYPMAESQMLSSDSMPLKDRCGFCKEGTYCLCAEEAAQARAAEAGTEIPTETPSLEAALPPPLSQQTETPPPSEPDVVPHPLVMEMTADGAVKLPPRRSRQVNQPMTGSGGCGAGGPGTCAQCRADPKSGLFCRLMAARLDREQGGCCGGRGPGGGCCKSGPTPERITLPSLPSLGLSCAEAYQTLSSHRNFDRAADDMGSWLPKLKAAAPGRGSDNQQRGRHAIEVEAASIMSVLKEFDVRFGREC